MEELELEITEHAIRDKGEGEAQLGADVAAVGSLSRLEGDGSHVPDLAHAHDHAYDTAAEGADGGETGRQLVGLVVVLRVVTCEAALVEEVIAEGDALVDGEPVADEVHEVLEHVLEVGVSGDGDGDVDCGADGGPDEAGHGLGPAAENLQGQADGVDVGAVVGDDGEGEDDEAELAEAA